MPRFRGCVMRSLSVSVIGLFLLAAGTSANAQGFKYVFTGAGSGELDGSFLVLNGSGGGAAVIGNLGAARILDSYGSGASFDILAAPNSVTDFAVSGFNAAGFSGEIRCEMFGYLATSSTVILTGNPASISFSSNLFFPGNPDGGLIPGSWQVTAIPEPEGFSILAVGAGAMLRQSLLRRCLSAIASRRQVALS